MTILKKILMAAVCGVISAGGAFAQKKAVNKEMAVQLYSAKDLIGNPETVGKMEFQNKENQSDYDRFAVKVKPGVAFTLGTISQTSNPDNPEFFYFPDMSQAPSGASKWQIYGGDVKILGNNLIVTGQNKGDVLFGDGGSDSLRALKATVDSLVTSVNNINNAINTINGQIADLDRRVTALENP